MSIEFFVQGHARYRRTIQAPRIHYPNNILEKFIEDENDNERKMLALPARLGGLGIPNPVESTHIAHENSRFISAPLVKLILLQETEIEARDILDETKMLRYIVDKNAEETSKQKLQAVLGRASPELKVSVQAVSQKGASN